MAKAGDKTLIIILLLLFVVAFGVICALCYVKWKSNRKVQGDIDVLKQKITLEEDRKKRIPELKQKKSQIVEAINQLTKILPTEAETAHSVFLRLLRGFAGESGVVVKSLLPPVEERKLEMRIKRYKYSILVDATFPQFVKFLNQIETHERFLKVDWFEVSNESTGVDNWPEDPEKKIKLQITTYTYNPAE